MVYCERFGARRSEARLVELCTGASSAPSAGADDAAPVSRARVALLTAARRAPHTTAAIAEALESPVRELLSIGGASLICNSLEALLRAGVEVVVLLVAHRGDEIVEHVRTKFANRPMRFEFVSLGEGWRGTHAMSLLMAQHTTPA